MYVPLTTTSVQQFQARVVSSSIIMPVASLLWQFLVHFHYRDSKFMIEIIASQCYSSALVCIFCCADLGIGVCACYVNVWCHYITKATADRESFRSRRSTYLRSRCGHAAKRIYYKHWIGNAFSSRRTHSALWTGVAVCRLLSVWQYLRVAPNSVVLDRELAAERLNGGLFRVRGWTIE